MIKIGILPTYNQNENRPFLNTFSFVNNYIDKLYQNKAIPIGIMFPNGNFDEKLLKPYDGLLLPGGSTIKSYHILSVHYAVKNKIPVLGICMGLQAIGIYSFIIEKLKETNQEITYENIFNLYNKTDENKYLQKVNNHNNEKIFKNSSIFKASHKINIKKNTILYKIYKKKYITEPSIHNYVLKSITSDYIVSATSPEGYIEAIEHKKETIIGVQFHPEIENKNNVLFKYFIKKCQDK